MAEPAIRAYAPADLAGVVDLWSRCGLTRPWNDPADDIEFCLSSGHGTVLVAASADQAGIAATVMVGHDGHRGWIYYLAVDPARRRQGLGRRMAEAAETWLRERGVPKVELMIRAENDDVAAFYTRLGFLDSGVRVMERWLRPPKHPTAGARRIETVVTHLELRAKPIAHTPVRTQHKLALLRVTEPSVAFYRYLYDTVGEPWFWYQRRAMDDGTLHAAIRAPGVEISVLYADGEPAGFAEVDYSDKANVHLVYFGLMPRFIGHRLGMHLLGETLDEAWRRGPERIWVQTCTLDHPRALRLYQRMGFVPYKQETKVIDDPRDLGLIPATVPLPPTARLAAPAKERIVRGHEPRETET